MWGEVIILNKEKIKEAIKTLLEALGYDLNDEHLKDTPQRVADMWEEFITQSLYNDDMPTWIEHSDLVIIKGIKFYSFCPHHLLPWYGEVHVAYIPNEHIVGLSKIVRIVRCVLSRLIIQERATELIADEISKKVGTPHVLVVVKARHLCMAMRGVRQDVDTITTATRGIFKENTIFRMECLRFINM